VAQDHHEAQSVSNTACTRINYVRD